MIHRLKFNQVWDRIYACFVVVYRYQVLPTNFLSSGLSFTELNWPVNRMTRVFIFDCDCCFSEECVRFLWLENKRSKKGSQVRNLPLNDYNCRANLIYLQLFLLYFCYSCYSCIIAWLPFAWLVMAFACSLSPDGVVSCCFSLLLLLSLSFSINVTGMRLMLLLL